jgi:hypothetical protein
LGFQDVLVPFNKYFKEKVCCDLGKSQPCNANETKDIDYFLTLPFMTATAQQRKRLIKEQAARLHFAAFINTRINEGGVAFNKS